VRDIWGMKSSRAAVVATLSAVAGLQACSDGAMGGGACTAVFASIPVTLIDGAGQPVEHATVTAVLVRTGQTLTPTGLLLNIPGTYTLVDDGSTGVIRQSGDPVQAHVTKGTQSQTVDYVFSVPDGCHVSKVSGPDTVTLQ
jgi:hypothetical protein